MLSFEYFCIISAFVIGWLGIDLIAVGMMRIRTPLLYNIAFAFISGFGMYFYIFKFGGMGYAG